MKFKNSAIYLLFFLSVVFLSGCETLETLNENPNQPEEVSADVLLTSAIRSSVNSMATESFLLGNNIAQLTAKTLRTEVDVYSWNAFPTVWTEMYNSLANVNDATRIAKEKGNSAMEGATLVMKSWIFSVLTLAYGDIPYTEAIMGPYDDTWFPGYDSQESIFTGEEGILPELERAGQLLASGEGAVGGDILFGGDVLKWQKFANSLRLRLLMHLSLKKDVSSEFADIVNNSPIMESNADNAILQYTGSFPNEFPTVPMKQGDFDAVVMSESAVGTMQAYKDPRLSKYARPSNIDEVVNDPSTEPVYDGAVNGLETGGCDKSGSRLGLMFYDYPNHPSQAQKANGIIMSYAELEFLLAEAANKGWIDGAGEHFRSGIKASMDYYDVNYAEFDWSDFEDYYANSGVAYDEDILSIYKQKWLSLFFHGLEPWFEIRRWMAENDNQWAALPFISPPCQNTNDDILPSRFLYPGNEQSLNPDNYKAAVSDLGGSNSQNAKMWLIK